MRQKIRDWWRWPWNKRKELQKQLIETNTLHAETSEQLLQMTERYEKCCSDIIIAANKYTSMKKSFEKKIEEIEVKKAFYE